MGHLRGAAFWRRRRSADRNCCGCVPHTDPETERRDRPVEGPGNENAKRGRATDLKRAGGAPEERQDGHNIAPRLDLRKTGSTKSLLRTDAYLSLATHSALRGISFPLPAVTFFSRATGAIIDEHRGALLGGLFGWFHLQYVRRNKSAPDQAELATLMPTTAITPAITRFAAFIVVPSIGGDRERCLA